MNITLDYKDALKQVSKDLNELQRKMIPRAANRTNNRVAVTARKEAVKEFGKTLGKTTGLTPSGFKDAIRIKNSTVKTLIATLSAHGKPLPLIKFVQPGMRKPGVFNKRTVRKSFDVMQSKMNKHVSYASKGVVAKPWGKRRTFDHTFIGKMKSGHVGVYVRKGKARLQIKELYGPGIPGEFLDSKLQSHLKRTIEQHWRPRFERELAEYLRRFNG